MAPRNRELGTPQAVPSIPGFSPGGGDYQIIRTLDGHMPNENGLEGANPHQPSAELMSWDEVEPFWPTSPDAEFGD